MTYVAATTSRQRVATIGAVAILHAGLGYVLVTGLSASFVREIPAIFQARSIPAEKKDDVKAPLPPRQPDRPPIRQDMDRTLVITTAMPLEFTLPPLTGPGTGPALIPLAPSIDPPAALLPALPRTDPTSWIGQEDYPTRAIRDGREGTARFELTIDSAGKVSSCRITASSGHADLDAATCRLVSDRARFKPAKDGNGNKVTGHYAHAVRWDIPD